VRHARIRDESKAGASPRRYRTVPRLQPLPSHIGDRFLHLLASAFAEDYMREGREFRQCPVNAVIGRVDFQVTGISTNQELQYFAFFAAKETEVVPCSEFMV
jgi:hypothetical protein